MMRIPNAHEPALQPQEAAMLPATAESRCPGRLMMPGRAADFRPVPVEEEATVPPGTGRINLVLPRREADFCAVEPPLDETPQKAVRRGSAAGRAILHAAGVRLPGPGGSPRILIHDGAQERYSLP